MSSRSEKNRRMREKRAKWEEEVKQQGLDFLAKEQSRRNAEREKAKERAVAKSKKLAEKHGKASQTKSYKKLPKSGRRALRGMGTIENEKA